MYILHIDSRILLFPTFLIFGLFFIVMAVLIWDPGTISVYEIK